MASTRRPLQHLEAAGHLDGATESLLADLTERVARRHESARLAQVREAMLGALASVAQRHPLADRVRAAADLQELWSLRSRLTDLVASHHGDRSHRILRTIAARFVGEGPAGS